MSILEKYNNEFDPAFAGQVATLEDSNIKSRSAEQIIEFGEAVVVGKTAGSTVKKIKKSKVSITYSADFVASNSIPLTVNGVAITPIVYATSHSATFSALISAIDALDGINAVAGTGREILINTENHLQNITLSDYAVSGGASQPTTTIAYSSNDTFEGVATIRHNQPITVGGADKYQEFDSVNVLTKGVVWVKTVSSVSYGDSVYVYNDKANPNNQGQFTNSSSGNLAVSGAKFVSAVSGSLSTPALAKIELNLPA